MNTVQELHNKAMELAEHALLAARASDKDQAADLNRQALDLEREAASQLPATIENEPSRSILYRSAATLALDCHEYEEAERLVHMGLGGFPPEDIESELSNLLGEVSLRRVSGSLAYQLAERHRSVVIKGMHTVFYEAKRAGLSRDEVDDLVDSTWAVE